MESLMRTNWTYDNGKWSVGHDEEERKTFIESSDFTHDVRLYVDGDFESNEQKWNYSTEICQRLNRPPTRDIKAEIVKECIETIQMTLTRGRRDEFYRGQLAAIESLTERYGVEEKWWGDRTNEV